MKLTDYLDSINLKPEEIANVTGLSSEMITGIIGGTIDIMCVDFGSVLLLCRCLKLPLSDFAGYCGTQNKNWQISSENDN